MTTSDVTQVLAAVGELRTSMNDGFIKVYERIDKIDEKYDVKNKECDNRLHKLETAKEINIAISKIKEDKDFWKWVVRGITVAVCISLIGIAGKLIIFGFSL